MRGGHLLHVVDFAIGGGAAVIRVPVPTGDALFGVARLDDYRRARRSRRPDAGALLVPAPGQRYRGDYQDNEGFSCRYCKVYGSIRR